MALQVSLWGDLSQALLALGPVGPASRRARSTARTALLVLLLAARHMAWALSLDPSSIGRWSAGGSSPTKQGTLNGMIRGNSGATPSTAVHRWSTPVLHAERSHTTAFGSATPLFREDSMASNAVHRSSTVVHRVPSSPAYRLSTPVVLGDPMPGLVQSDMAALGAMGGSGAPAIRLVWDVQFAWGSIYTVRVTAYGLKPEHRLCPLKFSWTWGYDEVIWSTRDAHAEDGGDCSRIARDKYMDESSVASCARRPTVWGGRRKTLAGGSVASFYMVIGNAKWGSWKLLSPGQPSIGLSGYSCSDFRPTSPSPVNAPGRDRSTEALASFESLCIKGRWAVTSSNGC